MGDRADSSGTDPIASSVSDRAVRVRCVLIKSGGILVSTLYAEDEKWCAERQITAHNIALSANPLSSPQGLNEVARMLADGRITARIRSTVKLDSAGQMLEKLRNGGLRGQGHCPVHGQETLSSTKGEITDGVPNNQSILLH